MLTATEIKNAKPKDKAYKLTDSGGLHIAVTPSGSKLWRLRYEYAGKEKLLSIGPYPAVSLVDAREAREAAKKLLRQGDDPGVQKKVAKAEAVLATGRTFELLAREWHQLQLPTWSPKHGADVLDSLERFVLPTLGAVPVASITAPMVLSVLRPIEQRPAEETARRVRQRMSAVFVFGIASGVCTTDPAAIVQKAMAPVKKGKQPAVRTMADAREILQRIDAIPAHPVTRLAMRLIALTVVRPGTLATTPWLELKDLVTHAEPVWQIPADRLKLKLAQKGDEDNDHLVPLTRQAIETIRVLWQFTGRGPLCFPNTRHAHKPMSENALGYLLNRAGYHHRHVPHGWRSTFSTVMNERHPGDWRIIDKMLAHVPKDEVEGAYNRASYLARRRELAQEWADELLAGMPSAREIAGLPRC